MADDGGLSIVAVGPGLADDAVAAVVRQLLAAAPVGCSWLVPVRSATDEVVDFRIGAASGEPSDLLRRGVSRIGARLSELYPSMVGGPLWQLYRDVTGTGVPGSLADFRYAEARAGVVADSQFNVSVQPVLGGLLVWWQRVDENRRRLERTELLGSLGWAEHDLVTGENDWSPGMYRIFERDPALGPLPRTEQAALLEPDDRGLSETAWQTLDSGGTSDVTVRFRIGDSVKYLRILSDAARDAAGAPMKIYAVVQDVTAREDSRTALERLRDQLRSREMTALAEHRLAAQLQNMIQPVPREPFLLAGLQAVVNYLPAETAVKVGGDWYHAQDLPDGKVALAIGDVAGHGLDAANGMAHLRFALVAWLSSGMRNPGRLLRQMNRLCRQLRLTATAVVAIYDPGARIIAWARAGHLPPLLSRAGSTGELGRPAGLLLGVHDAATYPVARRRLTVDDLVLWYTDGLIERRSASPDELLDQVKLALSDISAEPGPDSLAQLRGRVQYASPDDDTCALAIRVLA